MGTEIDSWGMHAGEPTIRRWLSIGLVLGLLFALSGGVISWIIIHKASRDADQVSHTVAVETCIEAIYARVLDSESRVRGFSATGNASFLSELDSLRAGASENFQEFAALTADNPRQRTRAIRLNQLMNSKLANADEIVAARRQTRAVPQAALLIQSHILVSQIRMTIEEMRDEERQLLKEREQAEARSRRLAARVTLGSSSFGVVCLLVAGFIADREVRRNQQIRGKIEELNDVLDQRVAERTRELRVSEERLRLFIKHAPAALAMFDTRMRYLQVSRRWMADFRLGDRDLTGLSHYEVFPELSAHWKEAYRRGLSGEVMRNESDVFHLQDGSKHYLRWELRPWRDASDKIGGIVVLCEDITRRREAEMQLAQKIKELARSNQELSQFAYVASHDLQEPLRMVASYTQLLAQRYRGRLDGDAEEFIGYAVDGATRMQTLIEDLLAYSRVGTRGKTFRAEPVAQAVSNAMKSLALWLAETGSKVQVDDLPCVPCDILQLENVFQNLIGNAIKFRKKDQACLVRIRAALEGTDWVFLVEDNGIGLETRHFEKIFQVFQRLHTRQEYPGNGIGLAICKKIIERHHGRIWLESQVGVGTTFFFTIPSKETEEIPPQEEVRDVCITY